MIGLVIGLLIGAGLGYGFRGGIRRVFGKVVAEEQTLTATARLDATKAKRLALAEVAAKRRITGQPHASHPGFGESLKNHSGR